MDNMTPPFFVTAAGFIDGERRLQNGKPCAPGSRFFHSSRPSLEEDVTIRLFFSGKGTYHNGDQKCSLYPGDIALFLPRDEGMVVSHLDEPYSQLYCRFNGPHLRNIIEEIRDKKGVIFRSGHFEEICALVRRIGFIPRSRGKEIPLRMGQPEVYLLRTCLILSQEIESKSEPEGFKINDLIDYLEDQVAEKTDLNAIAGHFNMAKSTLVKKVRKMAGTTVLSIHQDIKMRLAEELLEHSPLSISEVAYRLGYEDPLYFSRVFKKHRGVNPRDFRKILLD